MNNDVRGLLIQAEQARERGDFKRALELLGDAIVASIDEREEEKLVDILSAQALVFRHLFDKTQNESYLLLAKHSSLNAVELAEKFNDPTLLCVANYNLGKVNEILKNFEDALASYKAAVFQKIDRPAMTAEMETRLAVLEFRMGDNEAMGRFEKAVSELVEAQESDNYSKAVWLSGAYMHMADALIGKDNDKAKTMLSEAEKVIASDMRLKLRKEQLNKLFQKLG